MKNFEATFLLAFRSSMYCYCFWTENFAMYKKNTKILSKFWKQTASWLQTPETAPKTFFTWNIEGIICMSDNMCVSYWPTVRECVSSERTVLNVCWQTKCLRLCSTSRPCNINDFDFRSSSLKIILISSLYYERWIKW